MPKYIMRLDDAAAKRDVENWNRMEELLDKYNIKPLVGVIPKCEDPMMNAYQDDLKFWDKVHKWTDKGWVIALHGYEHVYCTKDGGINPVNNRSEFAGLSLEEQQRKIKEGLSIVRSNGINPKVFFAPSHTFDLNTLEALKKESDIRIISDTVANKSYRQYGFTFVPQQSGIVRKLPFNTVTFCYHPNMMRDTDYERLESFLEQYGKLFISFPLNQVKNKKTILDCLLFQAYFVRKKRN